MDGVKLFTGAILGAEEVMVMPADQIRALTAAAHRHRLPVFAHPTNREGMDAAVENGVDVLAHATPIAGPWDAAQVRKLVSAHVALVPTMMLFEVYPADSTPIATVVQQVRALSEGGGEVLFGTDAGFMDVFDPSAEYRLMAQAMDWRHVLAALTTTRRAASVNPMSAAGSRGDWQPTWSCSMATLHWTRRPSQSRCDDPRGEILSSME